jgi:hypothetical protein
VPFYWPENNWSSPVFAQLKAMILGHNSGKFGLIVVEMMR